VRSGTGAPTRPVLVIPSPPPDSRDSGVAGPGDVRHVVLAQGIGSVEEYLKASEHLDGHLAHDRSVLPQVTPSSP
jgi:hypothetical protein